MSTKVKPYTRKDGTKVRGYAIYTRDRRTPILVDGRLSKQAAIKKALSIKKRGSNEVDKVRRLTESEQRLADAGKWVRSGRNGEKPGYEGLRGQGPPVGGYKRQNYVNYFSNLIEFSTATKTNPELWERVKSEIKSSSKGGNPGEWSARKAQLATLAYKKRGGDYSGSKKNNSLNKWTKEKWQAHDGGNSMRTTSTGKKIVKKYLPERAWKNLDKKEVTALNRSKSKAEKKGKQFSKAPEKLSKKVSKFWK